MRIHLKKGSKIVVPKGYLAPGIKSPDNQHWSLEDYDTELMYLLQYCISIREKLTTIRKKITFPDVDVNSLNDTQFIQKFAESYMNIANTNISLIDQIINLCTKNGIARPDIDASMPPNDYALNVIQYLIHLAKTGGIPQTRQAASSAGPTASQRTPQPQQRKLPSEFATYFGNDISKVEDLIDKYNNIRQGKESYKAFDSNGQRRFGITNANDILSSIDAHACYSITSDGVATIRKIGSYYLVFPHAAVISIDGSGRMLTSRFFDYEPPNINGRIVSLAYPGIFGEGPDKNTTRDSEYHCILKGKVVVR